MNSKFRCRASLMGKVPHKSVKPFIAEPSMDRRAGEVPRGSKRHGWRERRATHGCNAAPTQSGTSRAREVEGGAGDRESTAMQWKGDMLLPKLRTRESVARETGTSKTA